VNTPALTHADLKKIVRYDRKTGRWFWRPSPAGSKAKGKWTLTIDLGTGGA
jgi:hypothetical protein